jgi:hypothetical protein
VTDTRKSIMTNTGRDLILKITRPQYVPFPEMFISALAWSFAKDSITGWSKPEEKGGNKIGLIYEISTTARNPARFTYVATRPDDGSREVSKWIENLSAASIRFEHSEEEGARSIADALKGVSIEKSPRQAVTPLSPFIALLQNSSGVFAKVSPPDISDTIEQIFALGNADLNNQTERELEPRDSAAAMWLLSMKTRLEDDDLLKQLDHAIAYSIKSHPLNSSKVLDIDRVFPDCQDPVGLLEYRKSISAKISTIDLGRDTPFAWFHDAWTKINDPKWVLALPARRWVDWATTVLRVGFGFSYIWEANWCIAIANLITDPQTEANNEEKSLYHSRSNDDTPEQVGLEYLKKSPRLQSAGAMRWKDSDSSVTLRDVAPSLRVALSRGLKIRQILEDAIPANTEKSIEETLFDLYSDIAVKDRLRDALKEKYQEQANSLWEAVKYALLTRNQIGESADFYGLLKSVSPKYTIIEPATEWIAAISSISIDVPGGQGSLGTVLDDLQRLGLRPSVSELTHHLESAGLAQSAADADTAVSILSAY